MAQIKDVITYRLEKKHDAFMPTDFGGMTQYFGQLNAR